jgi:hypothetical protein
MFFIFITPNSWQALSSSSASSSNAVDLAAGAREARVLVAEVAALLGAAGGVVLRVEVQDELLAALVFQSEVAAGAGKAEVRDPLAEHFQSFLCLFRAMRSNAFIEHVFCGACKRPVEA